MKNWSLALALALVFAPRAAAQDDKKWKPYQFKGNEKYEYKIVMTDADGTKQMGYALDIRNKLALMSRQGGALAIIDRLPPVLVPQNTLWAQYVAGVVLR